MRSRARQEAYGGPEDQAPRRGSTRPIGEAISCGGPAREAQFWRTAFSENGKRAIEKRRRSGGSFPPRWPRGGYPTPLSRPPTRLGRNTPGRPFFIQGSTKPQVNGQILGIYKVGEGQKTPARSGYPAPHPDFFIATKLEVGYATVTERPKQALGFSVACNANFLTKRPKTADVFTVAATLSGVYIKRRTRTL